MRALGTAIAILMLALCGCSIDGGDAAAQKPKRPYAVLVVLDEFPGDTLLGPDRRIDAGRFPNFASLAGDATWFRNAYTAYDSTTKAVPLILDGIGPRRGTSPTARDHPHSIFTALGRRGYRIVTAEEATALCPRRYCPGERTRRPAIIPNLKGGRAERFARFIRSIRPSRRPTFWMKHALLPHGPWVYLPSGRRSRPEGPELLPGMQTVPGFYDDYLTRHNEQRYLLQLGFVDRLLGRLVARLKSQGMYDDTLIVVTADHGFAWQVGVPTRRSVTPSNVEELGPVPLFVKAPRQTRGRVSDALARTLDVTPTIADVLNVPLGYRPDGRSAFSRAVRARREVSLTTRDFSSIVRISSARWEARRRAVVRRRLRQLGSSDWASLYTSLGPNRELIGQDAAATRSAQGTRATISLARSFAGVRRSSGMVPCQIAGRIQGSGPPRERNLAIAVNGRIAAVGRSFHLKGESVESYSVMVPEDALRDGRNTVEVLEVTDEGAMVLLARS
ncbi:MAG TPA: sulfatase-like hydrolase/transferase [Thermoleophilaceae bacterium]|nr:sulfatase-like hydrolase/transferase [Thermoleophilaceae bacterium]